MYNNLRNCSTESIKDWFIITVNNIEIPRLKSDRKQQLRNNMTRTWNNTFRGDIAFPSAESIHVLQIQDFSFDMDFCWWLIFLQGYWQWWLMK